MLKVTPPVTMRTSRCGMLGLRPWTISPPNRETETETERCSPGGGALVKEEPAGGACSGPGPSPFTTRRQSKDKEKLQEGRSVSTVGGCCTNQRLPRVHVSTRLPYWEPGGGGTKEQQQQGPAPGDQGVLPGLMDHLTSPANPVKPSPNLVIICF